MNDELLEKNTMRQLKKLREVCVKRSSLPLFHTIHNSSFIIHNS